MTSYPPYTMLRKDVTAKILYDLDADMLPWTQSGRNTHYVFEHLTHARNPKPYLPVDKEYRFYTPSCRMDQALCAQDAVLYFVYSSLRNGSPTAEATPLSQAKNSPRTSCFLVENETYYHKKRP